MAKSRPPHAAPPPTGAIPPAAASRLRRFRQVFTKKVLAWIGAIAAVLTVITSIVVPVWNPGAPKPDVVADAASIQLFDTSTGVLGDTLAETEVLTTSELTPPSGAYLVIHISNDGELAGAVSRVGFLRGQEGTKEAVDDLWCWDATNALPRRCTETLRLESQQDVYVAIRLTSNLLHELRDECTSGIGAYIKTGGDYQLLDTQVHVRPPARACQMNPFA